MRAIARSTDRLARLFPEPAIEKWTTHAHSSRGHSNCALATPAPESRRHVAAATKYRPIYCADFKPFINGFQVSTDCFSNFGRTEEVGTLARNLYVLDRLHDGLRALA